MILSAVVAVVSAWLIGTLCVGALWPRERALAGDLLSILSLGLGVGLGITSAFHFASSLITTEPLCLTAALELLVGAGLASYLWWRRRWLIVQPAAAKDTWLSVILGTLLVQAGLVAIVVTARAYQAEPYSNSDGWTIWLMHARFIFRGGEDWPGLLRASQIAWTHPDYPLLVPASMARAWAYAGHDAPFISGLVSTLFGVATVGLLVAAVARLRHRSVAFAGGLLLLGTPFFVTFSSNQHADIPLGFYILSTLVLFTLGRGEPDTRGLSVLAGVAAGMAAWTKNEGMMFMVAAVLIWSVYEGTHGSWRTMRAFLAGLLVALVPLIYFKLTLAPANDLMATHPWERWPGLLNGSRHRLILSSLWRDGWRFGEWDIAPFLVMVLPLAGGGWKRLTVREWLVAVAIGLMLLGFYSVYLLTPWDLRSHLDSSLVRLLLQLWPAALFFWCLAVTSDAPAGSTARDSIARQRRARVAILLVNLGLAGALLTALIRQPPRNQLGSATIDGAAISVLMGEGWFERESYEDDIWAWSKGESTLLLRSEGKVARTTTLRFGIRGLGRRTVTASMGDRVVWHRLVGDEALEAEITDVVLPPGTTALVFRTDSPGIAESAAPGARALTFALYNPTLE